MCRPLLAYNRDFDVVDIETTGAEPEERAFLKKHTDHADVHKVGRLPPEIKAVVVVKGGIATVDWVSGVGENEIMIVDLDNLEE